MEEIKLHDAVALLSDLPEHDLKRGDVGTVIEVFEQTPHHPAGYIVEFVDDLTGAVYATTDLTDASNLMVLHFRREAA
jgi:hypothetical protein